MTLKLAKKRKSVVIFRCVSNKGGYTNYPHGGVLSFHKLGREYEMELFNKKKVCTVWTKVIVHKLRGEFSRTRHNSLCFYGLF